MTVYKKLPAMREHFLHFLWRMKRFDLRDLCTTEGESVQIADGGEHNPHAGPDFFNARIRIGENTWAGNVEMHVRASEWDEHRHAADPAYRNVILHVVWEEDRPALRHNGERIPCLALKDRTPQAVLDAYLTLEHEPYAIPCRRFFSQTPEILRLNWYDRLVVERLEERTEAVVHALEQAEGSWEEAFYCRTAHAFGLKINAQPFEMLARSLPLRILAKHKNDPTQLEALLFGQAGMLNQIFADEHPQILQREYEHLRHKYGLTPLPDGAWKFLRLRPANFPTLRIAQFAALIHRSAHLLSKTLEAADARELAHLYAAEPGPYWRNRYQLDKASVAKDKRIGKTFLGLIWINATIPFVYHYGKQMHRKDLQDKALSWLEALPPESNAVLDRWAELGATARNAWQSQALMHLQSRYCTPRRCLECAIGGAILR